MPLGLQKSSGQEEEEEGGRREDKYNIYIQVTDNNQSSLKILT